MDGVVIPVVHLRVSEVRTFMEADLDKEFALVRGEISQLGQLNHKLVRLRETLKSQTTSLRGELLTQMDDKLTMFAANLPTSLRAEPPLLHNVSFSGDSQCLDSFLYSIYNALAAHAACFSNEGRRIKWVARHLRPVGAQRLIGGSAWLLKTQVFSTMSFRRARRLRSLSDSPLCSPWIRFWTSLCRVLLIPLRLRRLLSHYRIFPWDVLGSSNIT